MLSFEKEQFAGTQGILEKLTVGDDLGPSLMAGGDWGAIEKLTKSRGTRIFPSKKSNTGSIPLMHNRQASRELYWSW